MQLSQLSILVTGGAGFIGSNIVEYLLHNNVKFVRILDNLSTGDIKNIEHLLNKQSKLEFMLGDITNLETCRKAMVDIDVICHQAAIGSVPRSIDEPLFSHDSNVNGFLNILVAAKENNIKRVVYASSSAVYGDSESLPKVEHIIGNPLSPYAVNKLADELYARVFYKCYGMETIGLRYFNVFGPKQNPNGCYAAVIPKFISSVLHNVAPTINGDGSYSRDFTYVDNVIFANVLAMTMNTTDESSKDAYGQVFNIGNGGRITILEIYNVIKQTLNSTLEPIFGPQRDGDIPHSNANIDKATTILGYEPIVSFNEGIKGTIIYYKNRNIKST